MQIVGFVLCSLLYHRCKQCLGVPSTVPTLIHLHVFAEIDDENYGPTSCYLILNLRTSKNQENHVRVILYDPYNHEATIT